MLTVSKDKFPSPRLCNQERQKDQVYFQHEKDTYMHIQGSLCTHERTIQKKKDVYFCKQTKVPHTPLKIHMLHMHPVGHEQPSILFVQVEEVTFKLELISTSKLIPKYCYNIQNAIAIYIYIYQGQTQVGPGRP